ncbi:MarR family winged helix-turn-helix transcriptional regulator [Oceanicella sp. SM1341]|uniref:MarR family winged helix-turn-helix transcriptional regulator n=1 Tax=Oceanicella sp. SM1341 TaxID=1548889 RepID=UPI000E50C5C3|nr:MarR family winged helix-turn-helix transcriptional regulator [Oceanicella sp. SM1341]
MTSNIPAGPEQAAPSAVPEEDLVRISSVIGRLRVLIGRRVISRVAIENVAPGAELSYIDVLSVVPPHGPGAADALEGTTVGAVAKAMRIDPSRASRLVSDMVERGLLTRVASPSDARSSLVVRTGLGERLHAELHAVKLRLLHEVLEDWPAEDVARFAELFERFIGLWENRMDRAGGG